MATSPQPKSRGAQVKENVYAWEGKDLSLIHI